MSHFVTATDPDTGLQYIYFPEHGPSPDDPGGGGSLARIEEAHRCVAKCKITAKGTVKMALLTLKQSEKMGVPDFPTATGKTLEYMEQIFKGVFVPRE